MVEAEGDAVSDQRARLGGQETVIAARQSRVQSRSTLRLRLSESRAALRARRLTGCATVQQAQFDAATQVVVEMTAATLDISDPVVPTPDVSAPVVPDLDVPAPESEATGPVHCPAPARKRRWTPMRATKAAEAMAPATPTPAPVAQRQGGQAYFPASTAPAEHSSMFAGLLTAASGLSAGLPVEVAPTETQMALPHDDPPPGEDPQEATQPLAETPPEPAESAPPEEFAPAPEAEERAEEEAEADGSAHDAGSPESAALDAIDITLVPGMGPGMVIRLRQAGIDSIDTLAGADPEALRESLGSISRLLNIETWIDFARSARKGATQATRGAT